MRIIAQFEKEQIAQRFSYFLQKENIENTLEMQLDQKTNQISYIIWVHDEDDLSKATSFLKEFQKNPNDHHFDVSLQELQKEEPQEELSKEEEIKRLQTIIPSKQAARKPVMYFLTAFFFVACVLFFFISLMQKINMTKEGNFLSGFQFTPIEMSMIYDVPQELVVFNQKIQTLPIEPEKPIDKQPLEVQEAIKNFENQPQGLYDSVVEKLTNPNKPLQMPDIGFTKIKKGEVYRIISPIFLHGGFLHILFNMLWLWVLGRQIEERLSRFKYLLLVMNQK